MIPMRSRLFILVYLLCAMLQTTLQQPVAMAEAEKDRAIPAIYGTPPEPAVKVLREARPITERESLQTSDDMQQSESYTYRYYRPVYYPGVYYSYYPRYRWYRPYYYYDWWYY